MPLGHAREREPAQASAAMRWDNDAVSTLTPILSSPGWELLASLQARQETNPIPLRELGEPCGPPASRRSWRPPC